MPSIGEDGLGRGQDIISFVSIMIDVSWTSDLTGKEESSVAQNPCLRLNLASP
jgi:hypothetical protein